MTVTKTHRPGAAMTNRWALLALLCFTRATMGMQSQSIPPVAPHLVADLGLSYAQVGWLIGLFSAPGLALAFLGGLFAARLGDKRVMVFGLTLLVLGAEVFSFSIGFPTAFAGRLVSGTGFVLVNMLMMKIVTDRFAGRELSTAMGILMMSWPLGISLSLAVLGGVAESAGWRLAIHATAGLSLGPLVLVTLLLPGERRTTEASPAGSSAGRTIVPGLGVQSPWPTPRELLPIIVLGVLWGLYNSAFSVFIGFAPTLLSTRGISDAAANAAVSAASWVWLVSLPLGGVLADRFGRPTLFIVGGALCSALLLAVLPWAIQPTALVATTLLIALVGLVFGAPPGSVMALPAQVMRPPVRSIGFGIFYTGNYLLMAGLPPMGGWLLDRTGQDAAAVWFAGSLFLAMLPVLLLFLHLRGRRIQVASPER